MSADWADEIANNLFWRIRVWDTGDFKDAEGDTARIAFALRSAFQRGKVEALREAIHELGNHTVFEAELLGVEYAINRLTLRATALKQENKD
jgi:hypothetical protein